MNGFCWPEGYSTSLKHAIFFNEKRSIFPLKSFFSISTLEDERQKVEGVVVWNIGVVSSKAVDSDATKESLPQKRSLEIRKVESISTYDRCRLAAS